MIAKLFRKHLPKWIGAAQGHLHQECINIRTIKKNDLEEEISPIQEPKNTKTDDIMCTVVSMEDICKSYSDQTGKFPITSSRGHKYVFVFYHYDSNTIWGIPIKSCNTSDLCNAWLEAFTMYRTHGETPNIHILDNECSK